MGNHGKQGLNAIHTRVPTQPTHPERNSARARRAPEKTRRFGFQPRVYKCVQLGSTRERGFMTYTDLVFGTQTVLRLWFRRDG